eukprot:4969141-Prymnesium_polylepis.1
MLSGQLELLLACLIAQLRLAQHAEEVEVVVHASLACALGSFDLLRAPRCPVLRLAQARFRRQL